MNLNNKKSKSILNNKGLILLTIVLLIISSCTFLIAKGVIIDHSMGVVLVKRVIVNNPPSTLGKGKSYNLNISVSPATSSNATVKVTSDKPGVVKVSGFTLTAVSIGTATITLTAADGGGATKSFKVEVIPNVIISSSNPLIVRPGFSTKVNAYVEGKPNAKITWSSSNKSDVSIDKNGNISAGIENKTATIYASSSGASPASIQVRVTGFEGCYYCASASSYKWGTHQSLSSCSWQSSIQSKSDCLNKNTSILVSGLNLTSNSSSNIVAVGSTVKLTATTTPSNAKLIWSVNKGDVVTLDVTAGTATTQKNVVVKAISPGTATVTVKTPDNKYSKSITITSVSSVVPTTALTLTTNPQSTTIYIGRTIDLTANLIPEKATDKRVVWINSNPSVLNLNVGQAVVVNAGKVTGKALKTGTATITVKTADNKYSKSVTIKVITASSSTPSNVKVTGISVSPTSKTIKVGETLSLTSTVKPEDASNKTVSWTSSNTSIAKVDSSGTVTGVKKGTATITVKTEDGGYTATSKITVQEGTVDPASPISVSKITLSPTTITIKPKQTYSLKATVLPSDAANKSIKWTSSNKTVATVNSSGVIVGLSAGTATITATTVDGNKTAKATVTVEAEYIHVKGIKVTPLAAIMYSGDTLQLSETVTPNDAYNKSVKWTSSNTSVATVNSHGVVNAIKSGVALISATTEDGKKVATSKITVKEYVSPTPVNPTPVNPTPSTPQIIPVSGVTITSEIKDLIVGDAMYLVAQVTPSDATNKSVKWFSSNPDIAEVNESGMVLGKNVGTVTITVTTEDGGKSASVTINVVKGNEIEEIPVEDIVVNTNYVEIKVNEKFTLNATVFPENATNKNIIWVSSDTNVVSVDGNGIIKGIKPGYVTVTATTENGGKSVIVDVLVKEKTSMISKIKKPLLILGGILLIIFTFGIIYFIIKSKKNNSY